MVLTGEPSPYGSVEYAMFTNSNLPLFPLRLRVSAPLREK
jgi:hypothetical protein